MAGRYIADGRPSLRSGPPPEFQGETIWDWVRRQSDPRGIDRKKKKAPSAGQGVEGKNQNRGGN